MPSVSVSRSTAFVLVSALLALLVLAGPRLARTGTSSAPEIVAPLEPTSIPTSIVPHSGRAPLVVHVVGAVHRPGLYRLREGARVADAVERAGGATQRAELAALNLAAPLVDGIQVLVPRRVVASGVDPGEPRADAGTETAGLGAKPSLATAMAEELEELPGVGPVTAQKILDYRAEHGPFRSVDDLDAVPGIGPTRVEQLRDLVTP
ncbi:MAG: ComEA family DNA-binding protein [Actinomycetota bacterium]|nr:ComEA family DNA-binding protein [Actinomycetota bacterium]